MICFARILIFECDFKRQLVSAITKSFCFLIKDCGQHDLFVIFVIWDKFNQSHNWWFMFFLLFYFWNSFVLCFDWSNWVSSNVCSQRALKFPAKNSKAFCSWLIMCQQKWKFEVICEKSCFSIMCVVNSNVKKTHHENSYCSMRFCLKSRESLVQLSKQGIEYAVLETKEWSAQIEKT